MALSNGPEFYQWVYMHMQLVLTVLIATHRTITHLPRDVLTSSISLVDARESGILGRRLFSRSKARRLYLPGGM